MRATFFRDLFCLIKVYVRIFFLTHKKREWRYYIPGAVSDLPISLTDTRCSFKSFFLQLQLIATCAIEGGQAFIVFEAGFEGCNWRYRGPFVALRLGLRRLRAVPPWSSKSVAYALMGFREELLRIREGGSWGVGLRRDAVVFFGVILRTVIRLEDVLLIEVG